MPRPIAWPWSCPPGLDGGETPVKVAWVPGATLYARVGALLATGLHQVDNPVFGADGNLYVTYSGTRGQEATVSIFRITDSGAREPFVHGLVNPTSMALGPDGLLYVSSRFEGRVYRVFDDGRYEVMASDLGVACGLAFGADGSLYVGDRARQHLPHRSTRPHRNVRHAFRRASPRFIWRCRPTAISMCRRRRSPRTIRCGGSIRTAACTR